MSYSPFEISRAIATNVGKGFREGRSQGAIEQILNKAMQTRNPDQIQETITQLTSQLTPEGRDQAMNILNQYVQKQTEATKAQAYRNIGLDPNLDKDINKILLENQGAQNLISQIYSNKNINQPDQTVDTFSEEDAFKLMGNKKTAPIAKELLKKIDTEKKESRADERAKETKFQKDREFNSKRSDPIVDSANKVLKTHPIKKALLEQQRKDVRSGNVSGFLQFFADKTGLESVRSPESARFRTAAKNRYIQTLNSLGSGVRLNQYLEKQVSDALPAIGRSELANETVIDMEEFLDDMEYQFAKNVNDIAKQDREKFGYVKADVEERATEKLSDYAEKRQQQLSLDIQSRKEQTMSDEDLLKEIVMNKIQPDTPLTKRMAQLLMIKNNDDPKKAFSEAKKLGFIIPGE